MKRGGYIQIIMLFLLLFGILGMISLSLMAKWVLLQRDHQSGKTPYLKQESVEAEIGASLLGIKTTNEIVTLIYNWPGSADTNNPSYEGVGGALTNYSSGSVILPEGTYYAKGNFILRNGIGNIVGQNECVLSLDFETNYVLEGTANIWKMPIRPQGLNTSIYKHKNFYFYKVGNKLYRLTRKTGG